MGYCDAAGYAGSVRSEDEGRTERGTVVGERSGGELELVGAAIARESRLRACGRRTETGDRNKREPDGRAQSCDTRDRHLSRNTSSTSAEVEAGAARQAAARQEAARAEKQAAQSKQEAAEKAPAQARAGASEARNGQA
jgi:hypothetical protein